MSFIPPHARARRLHHRYNQDGGWAPATSRYAACPHHGDGMASRLPSLVGRIASLPRSGGGGPLLYWNFRSRFWVAALRSLGLSIVTPHSARHCFLSTLQAARHRGGIGRKARRPCERGGHAWTLYTGRSWRRQRHGGARARVHWLGTESAPDVFAAASFTRKRQPGE